MNAYKPPSLVSYSPTCIKEAIGPCQAASTNFRVTGGWDSASNYNSLKTEYIVANVEKTDLNITSLKHKNV